MLRRIFTNVHIDKTTRYDNVKGYGSDSVYVKRQTAFKS